MRTTAWHTIRVKGFNSQYDHHRETQFVSGNVNSRALTDHFSRTNRIEALRAHKKASEYK